MIRKLRLKFVCMIMTVFLLMLTVVLGLVIHFTARGMEMQSVNMLRAVAARPFQREPLRKPHDQVQLPFFAVQLSRQGEILSTSGGYFDLTDQEYVQEIVAAALSAEGETGMLEEYTLRYLKERSPGGMTLLFSDTTAEKNTLRNLFYGCLVIFFSAAAVFLGVSILLSQWAVRPVETAWDQQRQFVADASHELKTPLSVIMANAELLQSGEPEEPDRKTFAGNILTMTYQMRSLVENMLEMARVDNGARKPQFLSVDFSQIVSDAVLSVQLLYEEKGLSLESAVPEGIFVSGSEPQLYQVLDVLLDNALKYSAPASGPVTVTLSRQGRGCLLAVSSPGEPLSGQELKNIFKRFYRGDRARTMNGSYGLGLSIAESIVTAHRGKIRAESGAGRNTFTVTLPLHPGK